MRKSPVAHKVGSYKRNNTNVKSYSRGKGERKQTPTIFNKNKPRVSTPLDTRILDYSERTLPGTNIKFQWDNEGNTKNSTTDVWMSPEKYLSMTPPTHGFSESSFKYFDENYSTGKEEMYAPTLYVRFHDNQVTGHEGRHRAIWAIRKGIKRIPVHVVWKDAKDNYIGKSKPKIGTLKTQGLYEYSRYGDRYGTHSFYSTLDEVEGTLLHHFKLKPKRKQLSEDEELERLTPKERELLVLTKMKMEKKKIGKTCPECFGTNFAHDDEYNQEICLKCGLVISP
jgi:hypothetical protein